MLDSHLKQLAQVFFSLAKEQFFQNFLNVSLYKNQLNIWVTLFLSMV